MGIITSMRRQKACYWGNPVANGLGDWTFASPVEVSCRWEDKNRLIKDKEGKEVVSPSTVYVDRDMVVGGFLLLGPLTQLPSDASNPRSIDGAQEIKSFSKVPNLKVTEYLRIANL